MNKEKVMKLIGNAKTKEDAKKALFARIKQGDQEAKEEYIKGNLRLVLKPIR